MAGLEGIDATRMEIVDALGAVKWEYDPAARVARPLLRHADFAPVAVNAAGERVVEKVRFGMPGFQGRLITNARDDKLTEASSWKALLGKPEHHCLTAISYVVERAADKTATYRIQRRDGKVMVVPGLVARRHLRFSSTGNEYDDLCHVQITADANDFVATVHDRFVCELAAPKQRDAWMSPADGDVTALLGLLRPAPNDAYEMVPIASDVWTRRGDAGAVEPKGKPIVWEAGAARSTAKQTRL